MASTAQQKAFLLQWGDDAARVANQTGIPQNYILGQWALETGWGTHFAGNYNVGNIQGSNPTPYNYNTEAEGAAAYARTLQLQRYDAVRTATTPQDFGRTLQTAGYATDPDYANKVASTIGSVNQLVAGNGAQVWDWTGLLGGPSNQTPSEVNPDGQTVYENPLNWIKDKWIDIGFLAIGVLGLAFFAWKFTPSAVKEAVK